MQPVYYLRINLILVCSFVQQQTRIVLSQKMGDRDARSPFPERVYVKRMNYNAFITLQRGYRAALADLRDRRDRPWKVALYLNGSDRPHQIHDCYNQGDAEILARFLVRVIPGAQVAIYWDGEDERDES